MYLLPSHEEPDLACGLVAQHLELPKPAFLPLLRLGGKSEELAPLGEQNVLVLLASLHLTTILMLTALKRNREQRKM